MKEPVNAAQFASFVMGTPLGTRSQISGENRVKRQMFLRELQTQLSAAGIAPILVTPPTRSLDTGCAALLQIGIGLHKAGLINGEFATIEEPSVSWDNKFHLIKQRVDAQSNQVALLYDEPDAWRLPEGDFARDAAYNNRHTTDIAEWIKSEAPCRRVETISRWSSDSGDEFHTSGWPEQLLQVDFGPFSFVAADLKQCLPGWSRATLSDQRLLVALAVITSTEEIISRQDSRLENEPLAGRLLTAIANDSRWSQFMVVLRTLSIVRESLFPELIGLLFKRSTSFGSDPQITYTAFKLLEFVLLTRKDSLIFLHPQLQTSVLYELNTQRDASIVAHSLAFDAYSERIFPGQTWWGDTYLPYRLFDFEFWQSKPVSRSQSEFEAFYHAANCGEALSRDPVRPRVRHYFPDQLLIRAQALSDQSKQIEAASVFREVASLDDKNDFAHHYWALNLDRAAGDKRVVEHEYLRAIELNPTHPWRWSRSINFLITVGRLAEAREQWQRALTMLPFRGSNDVQWICEGLHLVVARLLLHRAQLEFASKVLAGVPDVVRKEDKKFRALERLLKALTIARDERGVFPAEIDPDQYWTRSHLDFPVTHEGLPLIQWNPARIDSVNEQTVCLIVAKHDDVTKSTTYGRVELSLERFQAASPGQATSELSAGRLLELAFYGEEGLLQIRMHPDIPYSDPDLPPMDPPNPRRYLENEGVAP